MTVKQKARSSSRRPRPVPVNVANVVAALECAERYTALVRGFLLHLPLDHVLVPASKLPSKPVDAVGVANLCIVPRPNRLRFACEPSFHPPDVGTRTTGGRKPGR